MTTPVASRYPCADSSGPTPRGTEGIYTVSLAGGPAKRIHVPKHEELSEAAFSPDGTRIVFGEHTYNGNGSIPDAIFSMRPDGSGVTKLRQAHEPNDQLFGDRPLSWQPIPR
jgi:Tol biopolymer transport system component